MALGISPQGPKDAAFEREPLVNPDFEQLRAIASRLRGEVITMAHRTNTPHLGGALSCIDILVAAYWRALRLNPTSPWAPGRDRLILSKGHAAAALYAALAHRGYFPVSQLADFTKAGGPLLEHPHLRSLPGVEASTGSLGHGLALGFGMALAGRMRGISYRVCVVMGDGECNEGSVWEAALFGARFQLGKMLAVVDFNGWQATGRSREVLALEPLREKWQAFGWNVLEVDGHDLPALVVAMTQDQRDHSPPTLILAHTIKGKGVSFMEDDNNWHYRIPTADEVRQAFRELGLPQ